MQARRADVDPSTPTVLVALGILLTGAYVLVLLLLMDRTSYDAWGAALLAPILVLLSVPAFRRQALRETDPRTFRLLMLALVVKLAGSVVRYYVAFSVYGGVADAKQYDRAGVALSEQFRHLDFSGLHLVTGTEFLRIVTGLVYTVVGPSMMGGFLVFSWLGFWGLFFFYRAFVLAVPLGNRRAYALILFFLPSLVFWPSATGKEAWMMFTLGLGAFAMARMLTGAIWRGLAAAIPALWLAGMVRPHIAALLAVSLAAAVVTRKSRKELRELAPVVKAASIVAVVVLAAVLVVRTERFLRTSAGIQVDQGVTSTLSDIQSRTSLGGSQFAPSVLDSPARAPVAVLTVLFRPFIFEAHNLQARLAALEGTALALLCLVRARWLLAALRSLRSQPYVALCLVYTLLFIVAFSSFANFGLLARERVQLFPLFLVLISIPPAAIGGRRDVALSEETVTA